MRLFLRRLIPDASPLSPRERIRSAGGALIGILATGLISRAALGSGSALPAMIAPMGASAVLLFAVPSSPLAQPWSIVGGNLIAALVGVTMAAIVPDPFLAAALAISCAIALMMALRCLHPPSGVNRTGFPGGRLVWVMRPRLAPGSGHSSALRLQREARCRLVRAADGD